MLVQDASATLFESTRARFRRGETELFFFLGVITRDPPFCPLTPTLSLNYASHLVRFAAC